MSDSIERLNIEQQFEVAVVRQNIADASIEDLRELFIEMYTTMLHRDNVCKSLVANAWGIGGND